MKYLSLVILLLVGCEPIVESDYPSMKPEVFNKPKQLTDCEMHKVYVRTYGYVLMIRCPNASTTTFQNGKTTTVVIDGLKYIPE